MAEVAPPTSTCEVCGNEPTFCVVAVPGVPISVGYGKECLAANAHPYGIVVANTAMCGGYDRTTEEWQQLVDDTLKHLGKSRQEFEADVAQVTRDMDDDPRITEPGPQDEVDLSGF